MHKGDVKARGKATKHVTSRSRRFGFDREAKQRKIQPGLRHEGSQVSLTNGCLQAKLFSKT